MGGCLKTGDGSLALYKTYLRWLAILILMFNAASIAGCATAPNGFTVITSPNPIATTAKTHKIFLAGSIEMGKATDWQAEIINALKDTNAIIYNPRRSDWNRDWKPELSDPHFKQQVEWELAALEDADTIIMYLAPNTQSPISLMELGLYARTDKLIIYCPDGFWRKGNVDAVAAKYNIKTVSTMDELIAAAKLRAH